MIGRQTIAVPLGVGVSVVCAVSCAGVDEAPPRSPAPPWMKACMSGKGGGHCERFVGECLAGGAKLCVEIGLALTSISFEDPTDVDCESYLRAGRMYLHHACTLDASTCKELVAFAKVLDAAHAFDLRADALYDACNAGYEPACALFASRDVAEEKRRNNDDDDRFLCGLSRRARRSLAERPR